MSNAREKANQDVFNAALEHIRQQREPSMLVDAAGTCAYRSEDDKSCAFAPAIKEYHDAFEGQSASDLVNDAGEYLHDWALHVSSELADQIQSAHDTASHWNVQDFMGKFESTMRRIAQSWNLQYAEEA